MKDEAFEVLLIRNRLRKAGLARLLSVHPNTVTQWSKSGAPVVVMKYLELRIKIRTLTGNLYEEFRDE